jgi:hypothetical protein
MIIAGIVLIGLTGLFLYLAENTEFEMTFSISSILTGITTAILWIIIGFFSYSWIASEYQADIINKEFKTNYTREEVFYGKNVIEQIQQIQRQRIEVNGNLFNNQKKEK